MIFPTILKSPWWLLFIVTVTFFPTLLNGFVWDDKLLILQVSAYRDFDIEAILFSAANTIEYLPVRDLTLALDFAIWGENPVGFHLSNLIYYLLTLLIVYRIARRFAEIFPGPDQFLFATLVTAIFALHPLHVEPVAFVAARNNILSFLFMLLSLDMLLDVLHGSYSRLPAALLYFIFALFSKAHAVFFPFVVLGLIWLVPCVNNRIKTAVYVGLPFLLIGGIAILLHLYMAGQSKVISWDITRFGLEHPLMSMAKAVQIYLFYFQKFLFPWPLTVFYPESNFVAEGYQWRALGSILVLVGLIAMAWRVRRHSLLPIMGLFFFYLSLLPVSNVIPTSPVVADRYAYPGILGLAVVGAWFITWLISRVLVVMIGLLIVGTWVVLDFNRSGIWRDDLTLFEAAYAVYPKLAKNTYAYALYNENKHDLALSILNPDEDFRYHHFNGHLLAAQGDLESAHASLSRALSMGGDTENEVHLSMAKVSEQLGRKQEAIYHYLGALEASRPDPIGEIAKEANHGLTRLRKERAAERNRLQTAAHKNPTDFNSQFALGFFYHSLGEYSLAEEPYLAASQAAPSRWEPWYNLGLVRGKRNRYDQAILAFNEVLRRLPNHVRSLNHIAIYAARKGDYVTAIRHYQEALAIDPTFLEAAHNLGRLYFKLGQVDEARQYLSKAKSLTTDPDIIARIDYSLNKVP